MSELADDPYKVAAQLGRVVVLPAADELFIDVDDETDPWRIEYMLDAAASAGLMIEETKRLHSKTPGHWHVYLRVKLYGRTLTPELRVALQACFGSDPKRELFSALRVLFTIPRPPTVFFEKQVAE